MLRTAVRFLTALLLLTALCGCDPDTVPYKLSSSIYWDGSHLLENDNSLQVSTWGRPFFGPGDLVFHLGEKLVKRDLTSGFVQQLTPVSMTITDTRYLAIDAQRQLLYFAADEAIYQVGFGGENLLRLSPATRGIYSAPALSSCGNYLTAVIDQRITRLDLQTGQWTELARPVTAQYAVFCSDTSEYYFFSSFMQSYQRVAALCKMSEAAQDSTLLTVAIYSEDYSDASLNLQASSDSRFFGMHFVKEPELYAGYFTPDYWERFPTALWVYDRQTGTSFSEAACFSYAFRGDTNELVYSRYKHGMADLMRRDLISGESVMIWDGFYAPNYFSYSISEIYVKGQGNKLYIDGWKKAHRYQGDGKSPAGRLMAADI